MHCLKSKVGKCLFYVLTAEAVGGLSAWLSGGFKDFYEQYRKPPLLPPSWLFPVVWVILYALMGYSAYLICTASGKTTQKNSALNLYWAQLFVNFLWSIVFFRFEGLWAAFAVIVVLLLLIVMMIRRFKPLCDKAAKFNIPYLIWVLFATYLNFATALINTGGAAR